MILAFRGLDKENSELGDSARLSKFETSMSHVYIKILSQIK